LGPEIKGILKSFYNNLNYYYYFIINFNNNLILIIIIIIIEFVCVIHIADYNTQRVRSGKRRQYVGIGDRNKLQRR